MADAVLVEFGIELTCVAKGDTRRRRKVIARWEDAPPDVWNEILRKVISRGLDMPTPGVSEP